MGANYYLDTAIWRDYYENRSDRFRPLGEWAFELIANIVADLDCILFSDFVINELRIKYSDDAIADIFDIVGRKGILKKVTIARSQLEEARILSKKRKVAFGDALHAVLARDNCAVLVTRDKHFLELLDVVEVRRPEELI